MEQYFKGKTVLVTGAGWGIGAATALLFAAYGAKVIVSDTSRKGGKEIVTKIKDQKGAATYIQTDVSNGAACERLIKRTIEIYGSIDIACNNSAIFSEPRAFNLSSLHNCMQYEIAAMQKQGGGTIVNTSCLLGPIGLNSLSKFVAAKYGTEVLQQNTPGEYPAMGIHINTIAPAFINTALLDAPLRAEKERRVKSPPKDSPCLVQTVAGLVLWLSANETLFLTKKLS